MYAGTYSRELHKLVYLQNRKFLMENSELRHDVSKFPDKEMDLDPAPPKRLYEDIIDLHKAYDSSQSK